MRGMEDDGAPDPFADGVLQPEELRGEVPDQPFACASCGLGFGDDSDTQCPACGADLRAPGALVRTDE
jgi:rubrerythrin